MFSECFRSKKIKIEDIKTSLYEFVFDYYKYTSFLKQHLFLLWMNQNRLWIDYHQSCLNILYVKKYVNRLNSWLFK